MFELQVYLRCPKDHPNGVPMNQRQERIGTPCVTCGLPLQAIAERERGPPRGRY